MLISSSMPADHLERLHKYLFKGRLLNNKFLTVCRNVHNNSFPSRLPLLIALWSDQKQAKPGDFVYFHQDQAWNIFLVLAGIFSSVVARTEDGFVHESIRNREQDI